MRSLSFSCSIVTCHMCSDYVCVYLTAYFFKGVGQSMLSDCAFSFKKKCCVQMLPSTFITTRNKRKKYLQYKCVMNQSWFWQ